MALTLPASYALAPAARILKKGQEATQARTGNATLNLTATLYAGDDHWAQGAGLPAGELREIVSAVRKCPADYPQVEVTAIPPEDG